MKSGSGSGRWENKYFSSSELLDLSSKDLYRLKNINGTILLFPISFFHSFSLSLFLSFFLSFVFFLSFFCFFCWTRFWWAPLYARSLFMGEEIHRTFINVYFWAQVKDKRSISWSSGTSALVLQLPREPPFCWISLDFFRTCGGSICLVVAHEFTSEDFLETQEKEIWNDSFGDSEGYGKSALNLDTVLW